MAADKRLLNRTWRLNNLYKIRNKDGKIVRFKPNKVQRHFDAHKHTRNITLKSRQLGKTSWESMDMLDEALFTRDKIVESAIIAHTLDDATDIFEGKVSFAWDNFVEQLKALWFVDTKTAKRLKFGLIGEKSNQFNTISVTNSARSGTYSRIHSTELSYLDRNFPRKAEEIIAGSIPALPPDGRFDIESTARGNSGHFYNMCMEAYLRQQKGVEPKAKEFKLHFYNWTWDEFELSKIEHIHIVQALEEMPLAFREIKDVYEYTDHQIACYYFYWLSLGKNWELLKQEYPNTVEEAFSSRASLLFDINKLNIQISLHGRISGNWTYFKDYNSSHRYGLGVDVAEGIGGDSSAICIWDFTDSEVVAVYINNMIAPDDFAYEIAHGGSLYGYCLVGIERNNHGHATISKLRQIYPENKIYQERREDKVRNQHTYKWGWLTTGATKPKMLYELSSAINQEEVTINSEILLSEMKTITTDEASKTSRRVGQTQHWDLLMAACIGWQMRKESQSNAEKQEETVHDIDNLEKEVSRIWG